MGKDAPHIRIVTGEDPCVTRIYIDGEELRGVRGMRFEQYPGKSPILQLDLMACDMEISGKWIPALPSIFKPFYTHAD